MTNTKADKSGPKPDVDALQDTNSFRRILELDFGDMIPFVLSNIRLPGLIPLLYISINVGFLIFIILYSIWSAGSASLSGGKILWQILAGILAGSIAVIPPHELLHGLAYRLLGARKISFGADFQQFIFYVSADRFPITKGELAFLALTPFVCMNLVIIVLTSAFGPHITLFSASLLLSHNIMCIGDFAMINYAFRQKGMLYTYDDIEKKKSYFFVKQK